MIMRMGTWKGGSVMKKAWQRLSQSRRRDDGASAVEYGLLVALIAVVIAGALALLGQALNNQLRTVCAKVSETATTTCTDPSPAP
jgi:pilus assembly protein Flp/PilA